MARKRQLPRDARLYVDALDDQGFGRAEYDGSKISIWGALPGETTEVRVIKRRRNRLEAIAETVADAHEDRIRARCAYAQHCGGCALQHVAPAAQRDLKRARLHRLFEDAKVSSPDRWLDDLAGPAEAYRRKARIGVRHVPGKGGALVGFRERGSSRVADVQTCRTLADPIGPLLGVLRRAVDRLSVAGAIPQFEIAIGDDDAVVIVRHLEPLPAADVAILREVGQRHGLRFWSQAGGPDTVCPFDPADDGLLSYRLPAFGLELFFHPLDFTQVNAEINRSMIVRALELLAPRANDRVLDLFCGLGNFTLPLATRCSEVLGVEGSEALVARGAVNAARNGVKGVRFEARDLYADDFDVGQLATADRVLLDPPRSGAEKICAQMDRIGPERVVYVSCNPETLARDANLLEGSGYRMTEAGIIDMFPNTAHVESIAAFERIGN